MKTATKKSTKKQVSKKIAPQKATATKNDLKGMVDKLKKENRKLIKENFETSFIQSLYEVKLMILGQKEEHTVDELIKEIRDERSK